MSENPISPTKRAPIPTRRKAIYALATIGVFCAGLGLIELAARLFLSPLTSLETFVRLTYPDLVDKKKGTQIFDGDPLIAWKLKPNLENAFWDFTLFSTNEMGLRTPDHVTPKPVNGLRVICMGDSVTFGFRVPELDPARPNDFNSAQQPYPVLLQQKLAAANPGRTVEVYSLAVPGHTSHQGRAWLDREIAKIRPDIVTICYGWNDTDLRAVPDRESLPMDAWNRFRRRALGSSRALAGITRWIDELRSGPAPKNSGEIRASGEARVSAADYTANVTAMAETARLAGAWTLIIAPIYESLEKDPPHAQSIAKHREALSLAAQLAGTKYLEVLELTERGAPANARYFRDPIHPNPAGHELMAERIMENMHPIFVPTSK